MHDKQMEEIERDCKRAIKNQDKETLNFFVDFFDRFLKHRKTRQAHAEIAIQLKIDAEKALKQIWRDEVLK